MESNACAPAETRETLDSALFVSNLRSLLKFRKIPIGELEREAGCPAGYLSRLDKPGNRRLPPLRFVWIAANKLGVSLDTLCRTSFEELSPNEKYLGPFLAQLRLDTLCGKLLWYPDDAGEAVNFQEKIVAGSRFRADLPDGTRLIAMKRRKQDPSGEFPPIIEICLLPPKDGSKLVMSSEGLSMLSAQITDLYQAISSRSAFPMFPPEVQEAIAGYLRRRKEESLLQESGSTG